MNAKAAARIMGCRLSRSALMQTFTCPSYQLIGLLWYLNRSMLGPTSVCKNSLMPGHLIRASHAHHKRRSTRPLHPCLDYNSPQDKSLLCLYPKGCICPLRGGRTLEQHSNLAYSPDADLQPLSGSTATCTCRRLSSRISGFQPGCPSWERLRGMQKTTRSCVLQRLKPEQTDPATRRTRVEGWPPLPYKKG